MVQWLRIYLLNAGDMGSILGLGRFHMLRGQLNPGATRTEPVHPRARALRLEKP